MNTHLRRIVISTTIAIAAIASSATISRSQMQEVGPFKSMADCEAAMQALLQSGKILWYQCYPLEQTTQPQIAPPAQQLTVNILSQQLDKKWKHASDFGITTTNKNPSTLALYRQAIVKHLNNPATLLHGTYEYVKGSKVYFNPITNLVVILDSKNNFVSGWKMIPGKPQFAHYINKGVLR
jgi:hypothetical protein